MTAPVDVLAAWDSMADSIANRRDECLERGQNVQAELYRDMIAGHREARAAVAELVAAVIAEREAREAAHVGNKQALMGEWRKSRERVRAALAKFGGAA